MDELIELLRALARHEHSDVSIAEEAADRLAELEEQLHLANKALPIWGWIAHHRESGGRPIIADPGRAAILPRTEGWDVFPVCRVDDAADRLAALEAELATAQAEARELRAELARVREVAAKWRAAPQNPDEPLLAMAADELEAALSQAAEQHDPLAVSDRCGECGEPEPECVCDERESRPLTFTQGVLCSLSILDGYGDSIAYREVANPHDLNQLWEEADEFDREHLARHGYRPTPAAQETTNG